jgi:glycosyltransferase involved in cell wall biosynthesis
VTGHRSAPANAQACTLPRLPSGPDSASGPDTTDGPDSASGPDTTDGPDGASGPDTTGWPDGASGPDTTRDRPVRAAVVIARLEGGAGMLALRGAKVLDPRAVEVTIVTGNGQRLLADAAAAGLEVIIEPSLCAPIDPARDAAAFRHLERLFRDRNFDVVHTHCAKAGAAGRVAAYRTGTPQIVHTYHGFPFHQFQSKARRQAYVAIERRLGRHTHLALCVGAGVAAEAVRRRLIGPERIRTIGVAVEAAAAAAASMSAANPEARRHARIALGLPADATVVGAVGRLTYQKAPEDFIAALRALRRPDVIGVWIGHGELAERISRLARAATPARIVLAGERSDVLDVLPALDVFVLPSRYEGLPTAIVEAMICGVPVIATAVNAVPDLVIPGETGLLVPPGQTDLLAAAVSHLLDAPAVAQRMAVTARAHVGDRYSEPALRDALTAAYAFSR